MVKGKEINMNLFLWNEVLAFRESQFRELMDESIKKFEKQFLSVAHSYMQFQGDAESPIEKRLLFHLLMVMEQEDLPFYPCLQHKIYYQGEKHYRVDMLLVVPSGYDDDVPEHSLIVECDGHDFHEKTKEQAKRDKKRDRYLTGQGYKILRFTGSEIHNDAHECVKEIIANLRTIVR